MSVSRVISVIGLGYVGLPVAVSFARANATVISFDIDSDRIGELRNGVDRTNEVDPGELALPGLVLTDDPAEIGRADFHIVTVPTPVDDEKRPDFTALLAACETVGRVLKSGDVVVFESTVYPGATRGLCVPVLERVSGLGLHEDFAVGYSPERINPGDKQHRFETITKVVAASDDKALKVVADVYGAVVNAGIHVAESIEVAEAAKVIENTQRDLNIALMNECAVMFDRLGIDTQDVLSAARTKWNFLDFSPGLVGGHCIGVDPYYLTFRSEEVGYTPEVILAGRRLNDGMGSFVVRKLKQHLGAAGKTASGALVTVLGVTFKENVPDTRNSRVACIVKELRQEGFRIQVHDPVVDPKTLPAEHDYELVASGDLVPGDAVVLAVPHAAFSTAGWPFIQSLLVDGRGAVLDVKACLDRASRPEAISLWRL